METFRRPDLLPLPTLSTERLELRPVTEDHLGLLSELNADARVMAHVGGRPATAAETQAEWRQRLDHQSDAGRGLGYWAGFEAGEFVGWWSASSFEGRREVSGIGYRLRADAWGRGLATEGGRAMVAQAFACPDVERVLATTRVENSASRRVLEKLGMTRAGSASPEGRVLYVLVGASRAR